MKIHKNTEKMFRQLYPTNAEAALRVWSGAYRSSMSARSDKYLKELFKKVTGQHYCEYLQETAK